MLIRTHQLNSMGFVCAFLCSTPRPLWQSMRCYSHKTILYKYDDVVCILKLYLLQAGSVDLLRDINEGSQKSFNNKAFQHSESSFQKVIDWHYISTAPTKCRTARECFAEAAHRQAGGNYVHSVVIVLCALSFRVLRLRKPLYCSGADYLLIHI